MCLRPLCKPLCRPPALITPSFLLPSQAFLPLLPGIRSLRATSCQRPHVPSVQSDTGSLSRSPTLPLLLSRSLSRSRVRVLSLPPPIPPFSLRVKIYLFRHLTNCTLLLEL